MIYKLTLNFSKMISGIVSNEGQEPVAVGDLNKFLVTGPMCRFSQDLKPMLRVLTGANAHLLK